MMSPTAHRSRSVAMHAPLVRLTDVRRHRLRPLDQLVFERLPEPLRLLVASTVDEVRLAEVVSADRGCERHLCVEASATFHGRALAASSISTTQLPARRRPADVQRQVRTARLL